MGRASVWAASANGHSRVLPRTIAGPAADLWPDDAWPPFIEALEGFLAEDPAAQPAPDFPELTRREREVLDLVAQERTDGEIADTLGLSPKAVRNYASCVIDKLGVAGRAQAIVEARTAGFG